MFIICDIVKRAPDLHKNGGVVGTNCVIRAVHCLNNYPRNRLPRIERAKLSINDLRDLLRERRQMLTGDQLAPIKCPQLRLGITLGPNLTHPPPGSESTRAERRQDVAQINGENVSISLQIFDHYCVHGICACEAAYRPQLSDPARGTRGWQPEREVRVRARARLCENLSISFECFRARVDRTQS